MNLVDPGRAQTDLFAPSEVGRQQTTQGDGRYAIEFDSPINND